MTLLQVERCLKNKEPVLLVGETGSGKTTVCQVFLNAVFSVVSSSLCVQLFSLFLGQRLNVINCHQHTGMRCCNSVNQIFFAETSDFLGGLRPVRGMFGC